MSEVCVVIDCSGSMASLSKNDIIRSVAQNLLLHEDFDFEFYAWSASVEKIPYGENGLDFSANGKSDVLSLADFIRQKSVLQMNILLLTDGFTSGDEKSLSALIRKSENLKFRVLGIGSDFDEVGSARLFPADFVAGGTDWLIFTPLEIEAALESFSEGFAE